MAEIPLVKSIKNLAPGSIFRVIAVLRSKQLREAKNGKPFLSVEFGDQSGVANASLWGDGRAYAAAMNIDEGSIVWIEAAVDFYEGRFSPKVDHVSAANPDDVATHLSRLVMTSEFPVVEMETEFRKIVDSISNLSLRHLVGAVLNEVKFSAFRTSPAARGVHQPWRGGLLEHTLMMLKMADATIALYPHLKFNRDIVVAGIAIHDAGKVEEYTQGLATQTTIRGRLIGHISYVYGLVAKHGLLLKVDQALLDALGHVVLSHHGKQEYGSPVLPCTPEAILVSQIDMLDSRLGGLYTVMRNEPSRIVTSFAKSAGTELVLGYPESAKDGGPQAR